MELPLRIAVINKAKKGQGLKCISLVDAPAIGFTAIKMSKQSEIKLSIQDEEQRIIFTPVLVPGQKIYRNIEGYEFNLMFEAESVKEIAIDWTKRFLQNKADVNHSEQLIEGVTWFESFLLNSNRVQKVNGFENMPEGTWFVSGIVENEDTWKKIKSGEIKGVSIDGNFDTIEVKQSSQLQLSDEELESITKQLLNIFLSNK